MKLRPEEITSILRQRIEQFEVETDLAEVGAVLQIGDGIARVHGLENCFALELLEFEHGVTGIALNLEEDNVGVALFGEWEEVTEGEPVRRSGQIERAAGRKVEATRRVDSDLIGGLVLQIGSRRVDASVRGRLERLRRDLTASR